MTVEMRDIVKYIFSPFRFIAWLYEENLGVPVIMGMMQLGFLAGILIPAVRSGFETFVVGMAVSLPFIPLVWLVITLISSVICFLVHLVAYYMQAPYLWATGQHAGPFRPDFAGSAAVEKLFGGKQDPVNKKGNERDNSRFVMSDAQKRRMSELCGTYEDSPTETEARSFFRQTSRSFLRRP